MASREILLHHQADRVERIFGGWGVHVVMPGLPEARARRAGYPCKCGEGHSWERLPRNDKEIVLLSRSMLEILLEVSVGIDVPGAHVAEGRTSPATRLADAQNLRDRPLINVLSGATSPSSPFAAVRYRNTWYWISDDLGSKRIFTFLMLFFSLAETGVTPQSPVLTIPMN